ncbi:MAG: AAA family ATPase [Spirochaetaceae bacterium]|nr:MAG: AAA family ATPase [Spirochaetaceae bacterium]
MHLRAIELLGFKSFPDKIRIDFAQGITALLGPNGCGKSNIVDAIKWVLGEQSAKTLRADKMEDIIFSGTENRKALSIAEANLLMGNDSGQLPLDVAEISIKRRLFRSGEGEYSINNRSVRLREIRELFFNTGIGKSAYSIMEQGRIDQILSTKPEDRRGIFEEAAGITTYRIRGLEAERKLEKTQENMRQVEGIVGEVKRSYDTLKTQAEKTESYRRLKEDIFQIELDIQLLRLKGLMERQDNLDRQLEERSEGRSALKEGIDSIRENMERSIDQVNSMESHLIENQKKLYQIDLEKNNKENQIAMLRERREEISKHIATEQDRAHSLERKIEQLRGETIRRQQELSELESRIVDVEKNIRAFEEDIHRFEARIKENEGKVQRLRDEATSLESTVEALRLDLRTLTDDIVTQLDQRLKELGYSAKDRERIEVKIGEVLESMRIQMRGRSELLNDYRSLTGVGGGEQDQLLDTLQTLLEESLAKIKELAELFEQYRRCTPVFLEEFLAPEGIITKKRELDNRITENLRVRTEKREAAESLRKENQSLNSKIAEYRGTLEQLRVNRAQTHTQKTSLQSDMERLQEQIADQQDQLTQNTRQIEESRKRSADLDTQISDLSDQRSALEEENRKIRKELSRLEKEISSQNKTLVTTEKELKNKLAALEREQVNVEQLQIELAETKAEIRNLYSNFSEVHSRDLSEFEFRIHEVDGPLKDLKAGHQELREQMRALGQVNLMAPEEFREISERYRFLTAQLDDLRQASRDLKRITEEIHSESSDLFLDTYNTIRKNFHLMFRRLFGGGRAELKLLDPDNVLESGIDIYAQPPGKKLENINLLSGGEKSLTAIALLFAFFMVRPSPFCILDEIDAALDDQNVSRFVHVLKEFAGNSQFIVVTHNKKTIACADTLLGVTMEESGISKIVTVRLENRIEEKSYA